MDINERALSPMTETNDLLRQILEQLGKMNGNLVRIEANTKPRPNLGGKSSYR
jgi:hypothetical protein